MKLISFDKIVNMNIPQKKVYEWVSEMILQKDKTVYPEK